MRLESLKYAFGKGYKTSISIEPFLSDPVEFIDDLIPYVTESIWVGSMNYIKAKGISADEYPFYREIRNLIKPERLIKIYYNLISHPLIRIKDAFKNRLLRVGYII